MQALNREHRGVDKPTDVLSFPMHDDDLLGDVVLCMPMVSRQAADPACVASRRERMALAADARWPPLREATFLMIHGILHLLGHDHGAPDEEAAMIGEERRLLGLFRA